MKYKYLITTAIAALIFAGTAAEPDIQLNPDRVLASSPPGASAVETFRIDNTGTSDLTYNIAVNYTSKKDMKGGGGPDSYGYEWRDSDAPDGPLFNWIEINTIGSTISLSDESLSAPIPLGFTFNFYGIDFTSVKVCSNGFLTFTSSTNTALNESIPSTSEPNNLLALIWDDLNPAGGQVYYYSDIVNKRFIVEYYRVPHYGTTSYNYAQVILYQSGRIVYQYQTVGISTMTTATVGIKNSTGLIGLQVVKNYSYLKDNLAVQFTAVPKWLSLNNYSGTVLPSSGTSINATCSAANLEYGTYTADLKIYTNDPDELVKVLPVTFVVSDTTAWPDIKLSTDTISKSVLPDTSVQDSFGLINEGDADLSYSIGTAYMVTPEIINVAANSFDTGLGGWTNSGAISWLWTTNTNNIDGTSYAQSSAHTSGGTIKNAILTSGVFDGTGCSTLYLNFYQYAYFTLSSGTVEYTADGVNWTTIYTKNTTTGNWGAPDFQHINLPVRSSAMQVRFTGIFTKSSGDQWSIDNVSISGPEVITLSWLTINSPLVGNLAPAGVNNVNYTCDAAGLAEGIYKANIMFTTNDPDESYKLLPVEFTVSNTVSAPGVPSNVVTSVAGSNLIISWTASPNATSYDVYSSVYPYGTFAFAANVTTNSYTTTYSEAKKFWYIVAKNATK